ncbi:MAG: pyridoxal phosphate-dependent aminotransferase [Candidatus Nezhaarchaeota archaeon]|nr:pyridoxal phosphate-dependent aminotransferase [Candidatus Nezhaarchaeota archaeon]
MPPKELSYRASLIGPSGIRRLFDLAQRSSGVINFGIGEPDLETPKHIRESGKRAIDLGYTHYTPNAGFPSLREAIAEKLREENNIDVTSCNVMVTVGASMGLLLSILAIVEPGDEVVISDPCFVIYEPLIHIAGGKPVKVPLMEEDDFRMLPENVKECVTPKTKCIIVNSPHNPTGAVMEYGDIRGIAEIAMDEGIYVISDEVYEKLVYDGAKHYSIASIAGMEELAITVNAFSKTFAMCGWRIGYVAASKKLIDEMVKLQQYTAVHAPSVSQVAALEGLKSPESKVFVEEMVKEYDARRRLMVEMLNNVHGFKVKLPKGAFYVFANIKELGMRSENLAELILKDAGVVTVPGSAFGQNGEGYLRFCYATSRENIKQGIERLKNAIDKLKVK